MPQIPTQEFASMPLRVHDFLADVPFHDAWAIDLPRIRPGITLEEFLRSSRVRRSRLSPPARALLGIRMFVGRIFGWDREPAAFTRQRFATRLTKDDLSRSLVAAGTHDGVFRVVYCFENEQLLELMNRTVHGALLSALFETSTGYRFYLGVYVRSVRRMTRVYIALIDPFRKLVVYPSLLRSVRGAWVEFSQQPETLQPDREGPSKSGQ
jgi:hypothetical protein